MNEQSISSKTIFINALLFIIFGLVLVLLPTKSLYIFHLTVNLSIILVGLGSGLLNLFRKKSIQNSIYSFILFIIGIIFLYTPKNFLSIFPLIFGLYVILLSIIKFSTFCIYKYNKFKGFNRIFFNSIAELLFGVSIIFNPTESIKPLTLLLGLYFIFIGFNYLIDFLYESFPNSFLTKKRRFRISMPIIVSLLVPYNFFLKINKSLKEERTAVKINKDTKGKVDLEIFIGVKDRLIGKMGHADLCFENKIYSYGHYDENSKRLFDTVGDGTLFTVDNRDKYLKFCAEHSKKTIFAFGISLTDKQKEKVRDELNKIQSNTYRWKCLQEEDNSINHGDYASCLYRATKAKFYKFNGGSYRLYYALWTNCVKLVDHILGATGSDLLRLNGVITPGAYYQHLNNQFKKKNSNVITKEIITYNDLIEKNKK